MNNLAKKDDMLDLSLFNVDFNEEQFIEDYLVKYEAPTVIERTWLVHAARSFAMVEVYRKSIQHILAAHVTHALETRSFIYTVSTSRPLFSLVLDQMEGELNKVDRESLEKVLKKSEETLERLFATAMKLNIDQVAKLEGMIERQFKNIRVIMQCLEQLRISPLLHKKLSLDVAEQEKRVSQLVG